MAKQKQWPIRIVKYGVKAASEFTANPENPRIHPQYQREAVAGSLDSLGWVEPVVELQSGELLDGHERIWQALSLGEDTPVPYVVVDLDEEEARLALATLDWTTVLADYDPQLTLDLVNSIDAENEALSRLLEDLESNAMEGIAAESENAASGADRMAESIGKQTIIHALFAVEDVALLEQAIRATGEKNRREAFRMIVEAYLAEAE